MKKIISTISILAFCLTLACAKKDKPVTNPKLTGDLSDLPQWVIDPAVENGVGGVGIASPSKGGIKFQIPQAELDAKANIAATIQSEISRVTKNSLRSAKINDNDDVEEFFAQATKEVVKNFPLSGVKRLHIFQGKDGTLYIHMALTDQDYSKFLEKSQKTIAAKLAKSNLGRENIDKSQAANKELFEELDKERKE